MHIIIMYFVCTAIRMHVHMCDWSVRMYGMYHIAGFYSETFILANDLFR